MGEIDTKPIESVQTAISFFGERNDQRRNSPPKDQVVEKDGELESLEKELANVKVQLEVKDSAYKQALVEIDHHQKTADELSTLLKKSDLKKDLYINESQMAKTRLYELESALERMALQVSEHEKAQQQLLHVTTDLESARGQLANMQKEIVILRETKMELSSKIQAIEEALREEKLQKEELLRQLETVHDLENRVMEKSGHIDSLEQELKRANELHVSSEKAASDAISELNKINEDMEMNEKKMQDQAEYISLLETELKLMRTELEKVKEQENEAHVEIAVLKFELHKGRSKLAAAEAAETRAQSEKSALYNALQQMGLEAEETKRENRLLKESMKLADENHEHKEAAISRTKDEGSVENVGGEKLEKVKRELELATAKIGELRTRAEQAISRAEAAEKTKAALEEEIRKRKEQKERRKAAFVALREESISRDVASIKHGTSAKNYQPLSKVLNMKF